MKPLAVPNHELIERPNWKEYLDEVCQAIVECEADMQSRFCLMPAAFDDLTWQRHANGKFRITLHGRPLIESPAADRMTAFHKLEDLADAADEAMREVLGDE